MLEKIEMSKPLSENLDRLDELFSGLEELKEIARNLIHDFPDDLKIYQHSKHRGFTAPMQEKF